MLGHVVPHLPQFLGSTVRLVQVLVLEQKVVPLGHWHCPALHATPVGHLTPQPPQLFASLVTSVHLAEQEVWPEGHWHLPPTHATPLGQVL